MGSVTDKYGVYKERNSYGTPIWIGFTDEFYSIITDFAYKGLLKKEIAAMLDMTKSDFYEFDSKFGGALDMAYQKGRAKLTGDTVGNIQEIAQSGSHQALDASKFIYTNISRPQRSKRSSDEIRPSIDLDSLKKLVAENSEDIKSKKVDVKEF